MLDPAGVALLMRRTRCRLSTEVRAVLDGRTAIVEHQFEMYSDPAECRRVHRTTHIRLRTTRRQTDRCYGLLRSGGDVWAWLLDANRKQRQQGDPQIVTYQALCRERAKRGSFGELSVTGARSVLQRYADAWFSAAKGH